MNTAICTLFEGSYHLGLAALVNSLLKKGFEGNIYAGYRGAVPSWALEAESNSELGYDGATTLRFENGNCLHFIPLTTDYHFTNYKPDFMLELWNGPAQNVEAMVYMDPDIVVIEAWKIFEFWMESGVALCEDVNSPVAMNHPRRIGWRKYFGSKGVSLEFKEAFYVNGGFVGLKKRDIAFVEAWKKNQELMSDAIGGLKRSSLAGKQLDAESTGVFAPFGKTDQDALNATIESCSIPASIAGKEAMGFISGKALLPHALGVPKPWDNNPLKRSFQCVTPRLVDKEYWNYANGEIQPFSQSKVNRLKKYTQLAAFIGRFYNRY